MIRGSSLPLLGVGSALLLASLLAVVWPNDLRIVSSSVKFPSFSREMRSVTSSAVKIGDEIWLRRLVDHRHLPFVNRFIAMLHASGAASTLQRRGIPHTRHSCGCASVPPDPTLRAQKCRRPRAEGLPSLARLVDLVSRAYIQGMAEMAEKPRRSARSDRLGLKHLLNFIGLLQNHP